METAQLEIPNKKILGQFFSGLLISSLLAELADYKSASTILDPMNGVGDMLLACQANSYSKKEYFGFEIDQKVFKISKENFTLSNVKLYQGNAFGRKIIKKLSNTQYDLIITNPPYVRYQTIAKNKDSLPESLNTSEIKSNLISSLSMLKHLDKDDRRLFEILISRYSGLSDLAVPSWILCGLNVKVGGRIALVVPETWMNRNYAGVIQYMLLRWFQIEYVVEDGNSAWFQDAQVKTTLIVAKRINRKESISSWKEETFISSSVYSNAMDKKSLVGQAFPNSQNPESRFKKMIDKGESLEGKFSTSKVRIAHYANDVIRDIEHSGWFELLEPNKIKLSDSGNALKQSKLRDWLDIADTKLLSLKDYGVQVSQGLRTGSNTFFYLDIIKNSNSGVLAQPSKKLSSNELFVPNGYFRYIVSKQAELDQSYSTANFTAKRIVLCFQNGITQSDLVRIQKYNSKVPNPYNELTSEISTYVEQAGRINIGEDDKPKFIPKLSAVAPNDRPWNESKPLVPPRFWYMLPSFTERHIPELFIPRVNSNHPKTRLNINQEYVVDANFSTLWMTAERPEINKWTILALLNSTWCKVAMEEYGTVMGGGALKLEATQIKRLPLPAMSDKQLLHLSMLGRLLTTTNSNSSHLLEQIDKIVIASLGFETQVKKKLQELTKVTELYIKKRSKKRK